jgi:hypothetical protein
MYVAMTRTKIAVHPAPGFCFPPTRFVKLFGILEDGYLFHGASFQQ